MILKLAKKKKKAAGLARLGKEAGFPTKIIPGKLPGSTRLIQLKPKGLATLAKAKPVTIASKGEQKLQNAGFKRVWRGSGDFKYLDYAAPGV